MRKILKKIFRSGVYATMFACSACTLFLIAVVSAVLFMPLSIMITVGDFCMQLADGRPDKALAALSDIPSLKQLLS